MRTCVRVLLLLALGPANVAGQIDAVDTFDACALRVESRFMKARVVRALEAQPVATLGVFGNSLAEVVASSDSAVVYALKSDRQKRSAMLWWIVGLVSVTAASWDYYTNFWEFEPGAVHYFGLGIGFSVGMVSLRQQTRSSESFQKAVWWYNRDLCSEEGY